MNNKYIYNDNKHARTCDIELQDDKILLYLYTFIYINKFYKNRKKLYLYSVYLIIFCFGMKSNLLLLLFNQVIIIVYYKIMC